MKVPAWVHSYVLDPAERAVSTFVEQFTVLLIPLLIIITDAQGHAHLGLKWSDVLGVVDIATFAALVSIVTSLVTFPVPKLSVYWDLVLRVVKTYLQSFLGAITAAAIVPSVLHLDWKVALLAGIPVAGAALLKGLAAIAAPWSDGASLLKRNDVALAA